MDYLIQLVFNVLSLPHSTEIQEILLTVFVAHIVFSPFPVSGEHGFVVACRMVELFELFHELTVFLFIYA
jgi:hypothetical protein